MLNQFDFAGLLTGAHGTRPRLPHQVEAAQLRLFKKVRQARPFDNRERYLRYLKVRYRFGFFAQPAYLSNQIEYYVGDLEGRSRLASVALDIGDLTIFLREVKAIGLDESHGARHLAGSLGQAHEQWVSLSETAERMLTDGLNPQALSPAIESALKYLLSLIDEAVR